MSGNLARKIDMAQIGDTVVLRPVPEQPRQQDDDIDYLLAVFKKYWKWIVVFWVATFILGMFSGPSAWVREGEQHGQPYTATAQSTGFPR